MNLINKYSGQPERLFAESNLSLPDGMFNVVKQIGDFITHIAGDPLYDAITINLSSKPSEIIAFEGEVEHESGSYPRVSFILNFSPFVDHINEMRKNDRMLDQLIFKKKGRSITFMGIQGSKTAKKKLVTA